MSFLRMSRINPSRIHHWTIKTGEKIVTEYRPSLHHPWYAYYMDDYDNYISAKTEEEALGGAIMKRSYMEEIR